MPDCTVPPVIVGVVVTHAAAPELLDRCVAALRDAGGLDHVVVVDNGGSASVSDGSGVELLRTPNEGYGAAANVGFARAAELGADAFVLLNDDVIVRSGWLTPLVAELVGDVGAVQPKLLFADAEPPTINSLGVAIDPHGAGVDIGAGEPDHDHPTSDIDAFTGGAVLLSRAFVEATGGFDERFVLYYEDADLAARGRHLGWRYRCAPASVVEHVGSVSTSRQPDRTRYLQERNRLWHAFRHCDAATIGRAVWLSVRRLRWQPRRLHARALLAGLAGAPRGLWERRT